MKEAAAAPSALEELAELCGVQRRWTDFFGTTRSVSRETLLAVLQVLGAPLARPEDAPSALAARRAEAWEEFVDRVLVLDEGEEIAPVLRVAAGDERSLRWLLESEDGQTARGEARLGTLPVVGRGHGRVARRLDTRERPRWGVHRLLVETGDERHESTLLVDPGTTWTPEKPERAWGLFAPLHALRAPGDAGAGHLGLLAELVDWTARQGGRFVGTLPLLPSFQGLGEEPLEPSPYAPVSRLFWGESWLDLGGEGAGPARAEADTDPGELVAYDRVAALRHERLAELSRAFFAGGEDREAFESWERETPELSSYARFRATCLQRGSDWRSWPRRLQEGDIQREDVEEEVVDRFRYGQWLAHRQMERLASRARDRGAGLYLDLPLGVHGNGYDIWRRPDAYASGVAAGAPPDDFFTRGQSWGFPPLDPRGARRDGYAYLRRVLAHHMRQASMLRIDHVMGLHRLFWIPEGRDPVEGTYVRYPDRELWAMVCIESRRHRCRIVGEDLGTVPRQVREQMAGRRALRMHVFQFQARLEEGPDGGVPPEAVASLNTHDAFPFAGWWRGDDVEARAEMGLLDGEELMQARAERQKRKRAVVAFLRSHGHLDEPAEGTALAEPSLEEIMAAAHAHLGAGPAEQVLVNLEDLWLETRPQNVPGTGLERPNWRRRARYPLNEIQDLPGVRTVLRRLDRLREEAHDERS